MPEPMRQQGGEKALASHDRVRFLRRLLPVFAFLSSPSATL